MWMSHGKAQALPLQKKGHQPPSHSPLTWAISDSSVHTRAEFKESVESDLD